MEKADLVIKEGQPEKVYHILHCYIGQHFHILWMSPCAGWDDLGRLVTNYIE